jgi:hypothetical protein
MKKNTKPVPVQVWEIGGAGPYVQDPKDDAIACLTLKAVVGDLLADLALACDEAETQRDSQHVHIRITPELVQQVRSAAKALAEATPALLSLS